MPAPDKTKASPVEVQNLEPIGVSVIQAPDESLRVATAAKVDAESEKVKAAEQVDADKIMAADESDARKVRASASVEANILRVDDQRRISGIWERTQQIIALSVVEVTMAVAAVKSLEPIFKTAPADVTTAGVAFVFLASVSNLVIGFYFGRTNHQKVGGDTTPTDEMAGR